MPTSSPKTKPTIAVIAVHGVADQKPFESARAIARLLAESDYRRGGSPDPGGSVPPSLYTTFHEHTLQVTVQPLVVPPALVPVAAPVSVLAVAGGAGMDADDAAAPEPVKAPPSPRTFHELVQMACDPPAPALPPDAAFANAAAEPIQPPDEDDVEHQFARMILAEPDTPQPDDVYQTVRLEAARLVAGEPARDVHVYEMYWADLSRVGTGALQIFGELFQILFHLCTLGRHVVDAAALENAPSLRWRRYSKVQSWAVGALTLWIAVLNILLVGVAVAIVICGAAIVLPPKISVDHSATIHTAAAWGLLGILTVMVIGGWMSRRVVPWTLWVTIPSLIPLSVALGFALESRYSTYIPAERLMGVLAVLAGSAASYWLLGLYSKRRPHAHIPAIAGGAMLAAAVVITLLNESPLPAGVGSVGLLAGVRCFELIMDVLTIAWPVFVLLTLTAIIFGWFAVAETKAASGENDSDGKFDRARRASFTARMITTLSATLFSAILLPLWGAFWVLLDKMKLLPLGIIPLPGEVITPHDPPLTVMPYRILCPYLYFWDQAQLGVMTVGRFFEGLTQGIQGMAFLCTGIILLVSALIAAWALGPIAWSEVRPPKRPAPPGSTATQGEGVWLNRGYKLLRLAAWIIIVAVAFLYPVLLCAALVARYTGYWEGDRLFHGILFNSALTTVGTLVVATTGSLLAFRGRLGDLALGFRPIVDLAFDVDNHLREHPRGSNPRVRISARYASLLRYIAQWRSAGPDSPGYSAVVIIAHSQGTVITADLLRFLTKEADSTCDLDRELIPILRQRLPVDFFTMGCPLRQLYSLRFPHLYRWARHSRGSDYQDPIQPAQKPHAGPLGIRRWVNAFRSGDYVGRYLWRSEGCSCEWDDTASTDHPGTSRKEFCIGAGAHTHYWDSTAPEIAKQLDELIGDA